MPSTVEQLAPSRVKLTIDLPFADLKASLDKAYREIAAQVNIPGFRKGKVPPRVIDQRFGRGMVLQEAINDALPEAYGQAINEHKLAPLGQPEVEVTNLDDGNVVTFTAEVDVRPEFDLPDLSTLSATVEDAEVSEAEVDERIDLLRQRFATQTEVERAAAEGDVVVIDLEGSEDGVPNPEATAEGISYTIGSGAMLDGLDEAVTGLKAGEEATFSSTLVAGPLAGQEMQIKVSVQKVQENELPDVDDDFAQLVSQFDTIDEMRADVRSSMEQQARAEAAAGARDKVLEDLISKVDFEIPEKVRAEEVEARKSQVNNQLGQLGITLDAYLEQTKEAENADAFWADLEARSVDALKAQLLLDKIADDKEIGVEQMELTQAIIRKAAQNNTTPEQEANHMVEHNHMGEWMQEIRRGKALDTIIEAATITDSAGNVVSLAEVEGGDEVVDVTGAEVADAETADVANAEVVDADAADDEASTVTDDAEMGEAAADGASAKKPAE